MFNVYLINLGRKNAIKGVKTLSLVEDAKLVYCSKDAWLFIFSKILGSCSDSILNLIGGTVLTRRSRVVEPVFSRARLRVPIKLACIP